MKYFLLLIAVVLQSVSFAQDASTVTIRTFCFQRDSSGVDRLAVKSPDQAVVEMKFPESFFSPKTKVPLFDGKVVFYNAADLAGAPVSVAKIPAGMKSVFVLFFPVQGDKDKMLYRTSVIDASLQGIPKDGAMVMNLYPKEVRAVIGEHRVILKPGKTAGVARPKERNDYNMSPVVFLAEAGGEWKVMSETLVRFPEENQQFFISYQDGKNGRLSFRALQVGDF
jgi:hypothetical protein